MRLPRHILSARSQLPRGATLVLLALLALLTLIVVAGAAYALALGDRLRYPDEFEYLQLAHNLATRGRYTLDGIHPTAARPPGYPLVLTPVIALGSSVFAARMLNFLALAASLALLHRLLRRHGYPIAALLGPALVLGYPILFYTAGTLYPQTIGTTLLLLVLTLATAGRHPWWGAGFAGLAFGLLILAIPTFALKLPFFLLALALIRHGAQRWRVPLVVAVAATLVVGTWTTRNAVALGAFVPLATNSGYNLLLGNSETAKPNSGVNIDIGHYEAAAAGLGEVERDAYYRRSAVTWVRRHPGLAARLYLLKALNYFNYRNELYVASEASWATNLIMALTYGPLLALFAIRLALARRYPLSALETAIALLYLVNPFLDALWFTRIRFRLPFDVLLIAAAAIFLETLYRRHWQRAKNQG